LTDYDQPFLNGKYLLERNDGKGGWTFTEVPFSAERRGKPFHSLKIKGSIDHYQIKEKRLMSMGPDNLFFAIKSEVRRIIGKKAGDWVELVLYVDNDPLIVPEELVTCLKEEAAAYNTFLAFSESEKKYYIDCIYAAKREETKVERIVKAIDRLTRTKKFYDR
jgi:hypothetical protein